MAAKYESWLEEVASCAVGPDLCAIAASSRHAALVSRRALQQRVAWEAADYEGLSIRSLQMILGKTRLLRSLHISALHLLPIVQFEPECHNAEDQLQKDLRATRCFVGTLVAANSSCLQDITVTGDCSWAACLDNGRITYFFEELLPIAPQLRSFSTDCEALSEAFKAFLLRAQTLTSLKLPCCSVGELLYSRRCPRLPSLKSLHVHYSDEEGVEAALHWNVPCPNPFDKFVEHFPSLMRITLTLNHIGLRAALATCASKLNLSMDAHLRPRGWLPRINVQAWRHSEITVRRSR
eukprot:TRINITY_DN38328_c0_g1_i1.p1 TRINITY_DN38328_c0_g1~~TRINITY_DN38328_c0_g1_i1.p1  ORF type:complete len:294 (-),score=43.64 TRINITY_DN38328_c0_g1_i1:226-1107(-)